MRVEFTPIKSKGKNAFDKARKAIRKRRDELFFATLSEETRQKLTAAGLDPASVYNEKRRECR